MQIGARLYQTLIAGACALRSTKSTLSYLEHMMRTSCPHLSGIFLSAYEQDVQFSQARWSTEFDAMAAVGINTVVVGETASNT